MTLHSYTLSFIHIECKVNILKRLIKYYKKDNYKTLSSGLRTGLSQSESKLLKIP